MKRSNNSSQNGCEKKSKNDLEKDFENFDDIFQNIDFNKLIMDLECESTSSITVESSSAPPVDVSSSSSLSNRNEKAPSCSQSADVNDGYSNKRICLKELGNDVYLTCELFRGSVIIHIRKFLRSSETQPLNATKIGVSMNLKSWYRFVQKISDFNLVYSSSSFVANNTILILSKDGVAEITNIQKGCYIQLDEFQMENLKHHIDSFNETVLTFLYETHLPSLIREKLLPSQTCDEDSSFLELRIAALIEQELQQVFKSEYICIGCVHNSPAQLRHACMTARDLEKFVNLGDLSILAVDFKNVAELFANQTQSVSQNFLENFNLNVLTGVLFKTMNDL